MGYSQSFEKESLRPMLYIALKNIHMSCALLSISGFLIRGIWMWRGSTLLQQAWVKRAPHIVDSLLLASAVGLAVWSGQYPVTQAWLSAKLIALCVYIALGLVALRLGRKVWHKRIAFILAVLTFGYIVLTARTRDPFFLFN